MKLKRFVGDISYINPNVIDISPFWISKERIGKDSDYKPSMWFIYEGWLYLAVCEYEFDLFEGYEDWILKDGKQFNRWSPGEEEVNKILSLNPTYFKSSPEDIFKSGDLDFYCEYELDFIKEWNRDRKIKEILS
jgi:hypothetical protein